ncbi:MAG: arsenate reductase [Natronohydrobacter sp.]|nr:arsenate reductase [Natronohydrobacter sp.]
MTLTIYGIKTCDTCRKALKALPEASFRDIRAEPLTEAERAEFLDRFGEALVNRASTTWRGLSAPEREATPDALLSAHPSLMKRPVIRAGDAIYLGWKADVQSALGVG